MYSGGQARRMLENGSWRDPILLALRLSLTPIDKSTQNKVETNDGGLEDFLTPRCDRSDGDVEDCRKFRGRFGLSRQAKRGQSCDGWNGQRSESLVDFKSRFIRPVIGQRHIRFAVLELARSFCGRRPSLTPKRRTHLFVRWIPAKRRHLMQYGQSNQYT